jgi:hypothetical protein
MNIIELTEKELIVDIGNAKLTMTSGRCKDWGHYREVVGLLRGMEKTLDNIKHYQKELEAA